MPLWADVMVALHGVIVAALVALANELRRDHARRPPGQSEHTFVRTCVLL